MCCVQRSVNNSEGRLRHTAIHVSNKMEAKSSLVCQYCLETFVSGALLNSHFEEIHANQTVNIKEEERLNQEMSEQANFEPIAYVKAEMNCDVFETEDLQASFHDQRYYEGLVKSEIQDFEESEMLDEQRAEEELDDDTNNFEVTNDSTNYTVEPNQFQNAQSMNDLTALNCRHCSKECDSMGKLLYHEKLCAKPFKCKLCSKVFDSEMSLNDHVQNFQHKELKCDKCDKRFTSYRRFRNHMSEHNKPHKCHLCTRGFDSMLKLESHIKFDQHTPLICNICSRESTTYYRHIEHLREHTRIFKCQVCQKGFKTQERLDKHLETPKHKSLICKLCFDEFPTYGKFHSHMQTHENAEKVFKCKECPKITKTLEGLKSHEQTHSGRNYLCTLCDKTFLYNAGLSRHMKTHTGNYPHQCSFCDKRFLETNERNRHEKRHTGSLKAECPHCFKEVDKASLSKHIQVVHLNIRPFKCSTCGKDFAYRDKLKMHKRTHTNDRLEFKCDFCPKVYAYKHALTVHLKKNHVISGI